MKEGEIGYGGMIKERAEEYDESMNDETMMHERKDPVKHSRIDYEHQRESEVIKEEDQLDYERENDIDYRIEGFDDIDYNNFGPEKSNVGSDWISNVEKSKFTNLRNESLPANDVKRSSLNFSHFPSIADGTDLRISQIGDDGNDKDKIKQNIEEKSIMEDFFPSAKIKKSALKKQFFPVVDDDDDGLDYIRSNLDNLNTKNFYLG